MLPACASGILGAAAKKTMIGIAESAAPIAKGGYPVSVFAVGRVHELRRLHLALVSSIVAALLAGCAVETPLRPSRPLAPSASVEQSLDALRAQSAAAPEDAKLRARYHRQRELHVSQLVASGEAARAQGDLDSAEAAYRRALTIDPGSERANVGMATLSVDRRHRERLQEAEGLFGAGRLEAADAIVAGVLAESPGHREARLLRRRILDALPGDDVWPAAIRAALARQVSVDYKEMPVRSLLDYLGRSSNVSFVFDRDVKPDLKASVFLKNVPVEEVLRVVLVTTGLEQKPISENVVLIYPAGAAKDKDYKDLMVKGFYLTNADAKIVANTIKTLVKTRDVIVDEKLNYIAMRDTPEAIRLAERLIASQDLPEPEVLLELEVLEVSSNRLSELGVRYPEQISASVVGSDNVAGTLRLNEWQNRNSGLVRVSLTNPALILNLRETESDTNLLANPRIRVKNRDKARVHIGERVPVITTTSTANVGVSEAVNYLDVGLKLEVEPTVTLDDDVTLKVSLEVSNILETITRASGLQTYRLGTRNTATTLRLRDSETQILAGLIQDDERRVANKVPGLSDIPVLGRLFSNRNDTNTKTEIVLLITPRIVRNLNVAEVGEPGFLSGTEAAAGVPAPRAKAIEKQPGLVVSPPIETPATSDTAVGTSAKRTVPSDSRSAPPLPAAFSPPANAGN